MKFLTRRVPGFPKMTRKYPKFSEDFWRRLKTFQTIYSMTKFAYSSATGNNLVHLLDPVRASVSLNTTSFPMLFLSEIIEISDFEQVLSGTHLLFQLHGVFISWIGVSLHLLGKCLNSSCYSSHFSCKSETLVRTCDFAWDWIFQLAGVRLRPKTWELAGICYRSKLNSFVS